MNYNELVTALTLARCSQRMTQAELARRLDMSQSRVSELESLMTIPKITTVCAWAFALRIELKFDLHRLYPRDEERP
jgi:transcriptional regulator with XRE-family HTH domain